MWPYFKPYKVLLVIAVTASIITASTNGALAVAVKYVLDSIFIAKNYTYLFVLPFAVMLIYVAKSGFLFLQGFLMSFIGNKVIEKLRNETFEKMIHLPVKYYAEESTGALMSRVTNDINLVQSSIPTIINMLRAVITMIGLIGVIIYMNWQLALVAIILYPIFIYPLSVISKKLRKYSTRGQESMGILTSVLQESFSGVRVVKAFVAEDKEMERFEKANAQTIKYANKSVLAGNLASPLTEALGSVGIAAVLFIGGYQVINGTVTTGEFFAFLAALIQIYEPVKLFASSNNALQAAVAASDRVFAMFKESDEVIENKGTKQCDAENKDIEFKQVSFIYKDDIYALKDVSFKVKAGSTIAFVGPSGAGKTTMAHLIPRFYDVTEGSIKINGVDIREYDLKALRKKIGFIPQKSLLFTGSIANNIRFGKHKAGESELEYSAKVAQAYEFISKKPRKFDELISEGGANVSGGQKQRVACARAIVTNPDLILADEPTGALDSKSARMLLDSLNALNEKLNATILMVTHDSFTASYADRVIFIKDGKIFNEIVKGDNSRKVFFNSIMDVQTLLGGELNEVI